MQFLFGLILFSLVNVWGAELQIPALTSPVMDQANLLDEAERADLSKYAYEIYTHQGPQITILTVPDLQGYAIEDFSIKVAEQWKLGLKEKGNGILITVTKAEHQMRIEIGQGIEGEITDFESKQYVTQILKPAFREGDFHGGLKAVMQEIARKFNIKLAEEGTPIVRRAPARTMNPILGSLFLPLIAVVFAGHMLLRRRRVARGLFTGAGMAGTSMFMIPAMGLGLAAPLFIIGFLVGIVGLGNILFALAASGGGRHGGGGFGGGGGGGWSGGGGGFSGGGSSGSW